jgi:hypothetical protein
MTKKELFKRIVEPSILTGLIGAYEIHLVPGLTDKQRLLVDIIGNDLYDSIGNKLTLKELQERYNELFHCSETVQKN